MKLCNESQTKDDPAVAADRAGITVLRRAHPIADGLVGETRYKMLK